MDIKNSEEKKQPTEFARSFNKPQGAPFPAPQRPPMPAQAKPDKTKNILIAVIAVLVVAIVGLAVWFFVSSAAKDEKAEAERQSREAAELSLQQQLAESEFDQLENEFASLENSLSVSTDSVKLRLTQQYESARLEVERLQAELRNTKNKSAKEIADLQGQIKTLRALLQKYIAEIDRLNKENAQLRQENTEVKARNEELSTQVAETTRQNKHLNERMTLAEKLNVTGVGFNALNKKGKVEKKVNKAKQLLITFTIPQNNSTPVGEKTIYARITTPEGQLLGGGGSFSFEGTTVSCSAKTKIEYGGQEIGGIRIYYDVNTALNPGDYTVELFADNYRLFNRKFNLK